MLELLSGHISPIVWVPSLWSGGNLAWAEECGNGCYDLTGLPNLSPLAAPIKAASSEDSVLNHFVELNKDTRKV